MKRREFVLISAATLAVPRAAAQRSTPVIGILWSDAKKPSPCAPTA